MKCFLKVSDDLNDYAEEINSKLGECIRKTPLSVRHFIDAQCEVLTRENLFQTELIKLKPYQKIQLHSHPDVDSIDILIAGNMTFQIGEKEVPRLLHGIGLRIASDAKHGGLVGSGGVAFISCQRWKKSPSHIGLSWA